MIYVRYAFAPEEFFNSPSEKTSDFVLKEDNKFEFLKEFRAVIPVFDLSRVKKGIKLHFVGEDRLFHKATEFSESIKDDLNSFEYVYIEEMRDFSAGVRREVKKVNGVMDFLHSNFQQLDLEVDPYASYCDPLLNYKITTEELMNNLNDSENKLIKREKEIEEYKEILKKTGHLLDQYVPENKRNEYDFMLERNELSSNAMGITISNNQKTGIFAPSLLGESPKKGRESQKSLTHRDIEQSFNEESKEGSVVDDRGSGSDESEFVETDAISTVSTEPSKIVEGNHLLCVIKIGGVWRFMLKQVLSFIKMSYSGVAIGWAPAGSTKESSALSMIYNFCTHFNINPELEEQLSNCVLDIFDTMDSTGEVNITQHFCDHLEKFFIEVLMVNLDEDTMIRRRDTYPKVPYKW